MQRRASTAVITVCAFTVVFLLLSHDEMAQPGVDEALLEALPVAEDGPNTLSATPISGTPIALEANPVMPRLGTVQQGKPVQEHGRVSGDLASILKKVIKGGRRTPASQVDSLTKDLADKVMRAGHIEHTQSASDLNIEKLRAAVLKRKEQEHQVHMLCGDEEACEALKAAKEQRWAETHEAIADTLNKPAVRKKLTRLIRDEVAKIKSATGDKHAAETAVHRDHTENENAGEPKKKAALEKEKIGSDKVKLQHLKKIAHEGHTAAPNKENEGQEKKKKKTQEEEEKKKKKKKSEQVHKEKEEMAQDEKMEKKTEEALKTEEEMKAAEKKQETKKAAAAAKKKATEEQKKKKTKATEEKKKTVAEEKRKKQTTPKKAQEKKETEQKKRTAGKKQKAKSDKKGQEAEKKHISPGSKSRSKTASATQSNKARAEHKPATVTTASTGDGSVTASIPPQRLRPHAKAQPAADNGASLARFMRDEDAKVNKAVDHAGQGHAHPDWEELHTHKMEVMGEVLADTWGPSEASEAVSEASEEMSEQASEEVLLQDATASAETTELDEQIARAQGLLSLVVNPGGGAETATTLINTEVVEQTAAEHDRHSKDRAARLQRKLHVKNAIVSALAARAHAENQAATSMERKLRHELDSLHHARAETTALMSSRGQRAQHALASAFSAVATRRAVRSRRLALNRQVKFAKVEADVARLNSREARSAPEAP